MGGVSRRDFRLQADSPHRASCLCSCLVVVSSLFVGRVSVSSPQIFSFLHAASPARATAAAGGGASATRFDQPTHTATHTRPTCRTTSRTSRGASRSDDTRHAAAPQAGRRWSCLNSNCALAEERAPDDLQSERRATDAHATRQGEGGGQGRRAPPESESAWWLEFELEAALCLAHAAASWSALAGMATARC